MESTEVKKKALVIGGTGFVGPYVVSQLQASGHTVTLLNRGSRRVPGTEQLVADRNQPGEMKAAAERGTFFDVVVDLSCYTLRQAELAWTYFEQFCARWVHLSSASVYLQDEGRPWRETDEVGGAPIWGDYGRDKAGAERFLLGQEFGKGLILRPPYLYGPGNPDDRETYIWKRALQNRPIVVPGDGSAQIQFLHAADLASAITAHELVPYSSSGTILNIASPEIVSLEEYAIRLSAVAGAPARIINAGGLTERRAREYFPFRDFPCCVETTALMASTTWRPKWSFDEGFADTLARHGSSALAHAPLDTTIEDEIISASGLRPG